MPVNAAALGSLIQQTVNANYIATFRGNVPYSGPLSFHDPHYFIEFCNAIATGIVEGQPTIPFNTLDTGVGGAPPVPGAGSGIGIVVDQDDLSQRMYTLSRAASIARFGRVLSDPWPPPQDNLPGLMLRALTDGVASAVKTRFATDWILTSVAPLVYVGTGKIVPGGYYGVDAGAVGSSIIQASQPFLRSNSFWPTIAQAFAQGFAQNIMEKATGSLTIVGACTPSISQVCGLPMADSGTGTAT